MRNWGACHNVSFSTFTGRRSDCIQLAWRRWPSGAPLITTEDMMRIMTLAVAAVLAARLCGSASGAKGQPPPHPRCFGNNEETPSPDAGPHRRAAPNHADPHV